MNYNSKSSIITRIILVIISFIVLVNIGHLFSTLSFKNVTFSGFLEFLGNTKMFTLNVGIDSFIITDSWGIFDFLRDFLNIFAGLLGFIGWFFGNLYNFISFIVQFVAYIFV